MTDKLAAMKAAGNEWKKGNHHRIYFNFTHEDLGLEVQYYNTGNVSGAKFDGDRISNSEARRIMSRIGKIFYDVNADKMMTQYWKDETLKARALDSVNYQIELKTQQEV